MKTKKREMYMETFRIKPGKDEVHIGLKDSVNGEPVEDGAEALEIVLPLSSLRHRDRSLP